MKILTLAFLFRGDEMLLAMKKRGFGAGKWNGYGGKLEEGEKPIDAIVREMQEESGLVIEKEKFREIGYMDFYFNDKKEWDQKVIIYRVDDFVGEPVETEEMKPNYFKISEMPYIEMWVGDAKWIPYVIKNKKFKGEIYFSENGEKMVSCVIE